MRSRLIFSALLLTALHAQDADPHMTGYSPIRAREEQTLEREFRAIPSPEEEKKQHRYFTAEPHPAGSERNHELALYVARLWNEQGLEDVRILRYDVLTSLPRSIAVEMVAPTAYRASLREDPYDADPDTKNPAIRGGYLSMSASGEATAPLGYAHSGNPEDYEVRRRHHISVKGKIVLVRYSNPYSYRGFKALTAQNAGAAGLLIYSDPAEDGFERGKVFPDGPWGPESHIQRGSITYDFLVPGDPLTPGWASVEGAKRIPMEEAVSLPKIMAVAMSWRDAKPLLARMDGPLAPKAWQGGLPIPYHLGGGAVRVHMKVDMDTSPKPNYVVEARIRGSEFPDEWIVLGNHRDAWEFGGVDPSSGTASLMELTRDMPAPSGSTLYQEWRASAAGTRAAEKDRRPVTDENLAETRIGSGSDFTVFLNHLCRPTVELQFDGPYGVYHSAYDDFFWMNHFGDPGYRYHTLMTQYWGALALRLAGAEILPFDFAAYGRDIAAFASVLAANRQARRQVDFRTLELRIAEFRQAGGDLNAALAQALAKGPLDAKLAARVKRGTMQVESNWANPAGIPGRPWFKHTLYAARFTYGHLELPGLTEAIEKRDWKEAQRQAGILAEALGRNARLLRETLAILRNG